MPYTVRYYWSHEGRSATELAERDMNIMEKNGWTVTSTTADPEGLYVTYHQ